RFWASGRAHGAGQLDDHAWLGLGALALFEATGDPRWRDRYEPGVVENAEFEWRLELPERCDIHLADDEHDDYVWVPVDEAIERVWSWTNREALRALKVEQA
ncbi:MAG: hypothetical protein AAFX58_15095, partial [Pseudomonadota bacterium]